MKYEYVWHEFHFNNDRTMTTGSQEVLEEFCNEGWRIVCGQWNRFGNYDALLEREKTGAYAPNLSAL